MRRTIYLSIIAVLLVLFAGIIYLRFAYPPADTDRYGCPRYDEVPAHTIVLIDQSDPFGPSDVQWVEEVLRTTALELPRYGRATILGLTPEPYTLVGQTGAHVPDAPVLRDVESNELLDPFSRCSPGNPDSINEAVGNKAFARFEWRNRFFEPERAVAAAIMADRSAQFSPLLEALESIAGRADFSPTQSNRRIIIISDMIQHSPRYSLFRSGTSWSAFEPSTLANDLPRLDGVVVEVRFVPRPSVQMSRTRLRRFWESYASATGATLQVHM